MSGAFDPYYIWLGIPPEEQPPNHYRLLGIERLESDTEVITKAAEAKIKQLRTFQLGEKFSFSQKLLGEIATARVCLLNAKKKAAYDAELTEIMPLGGPPPLPEEEDSQSAFDAFLVASQDDLATKHKQHPRVVLSSPRKKRLPIPLGMVAAVVVLALVLIGVIFWAQGTKTKKQHQQIVQQINGTPLRLTDPEKVLATKGFILDGNKWSLAIEKVLNKESKDLIGAWKKWKGERTVSGHHPKAYLSRYNELLLATIEHRAMRQAVSETYLAAMEDQEVAAALAKLDVKTYDLKRSARLLEKPLPQLSNARPKRPPIAGKEGNVFAALIINNKVGLVVHVDQNAMTQKDSPNLFILPRSHWIAAGGGIGKMKSVWFNNGLRHPIFETSGATIQFGRKQATNVTVHYMPSIAEGGIANGEGVYGGKVGKAAWLAFVGQLKPAPPPAPTEQEIATARKELERLLTEAPHEQN